MHGVDEEPGVVWFRRDLRLNDTPAWAAATEVHKGVIALFIGGEPVPTPEGPIRQTPGRRSRSSRVGNQVA